MLLIRHSIILLSPNYIEAYQQNGLFWMLKNPPRRGAATNSP